MRARDAFRLLIRKGDRWPTSLADPRRVDHVEVVAVESGETVLAWNLSPSQAKRLIRSLRRALADLSAEEFEARWLRLEEEEHPAEKREGERL